MSIPGTRMYAPQARLVDAMTGEVIGVAGHNRIDSGHGRLLPNPADTDLISARVTLLNHGVGQLQVVLNNHRNELGMPAYPPWKYNAIAPPSPPWNLRYAAPPISLYFGKRVRLDVRYGGEPWTKLILARITDMQFTFPASGAAQLTIIGEDLLSLLKIRPTEDHRFQQDVTEEQIVQDVIGRSRAGLPLAPTSLIWPPRTEGLRSVTHQKRQSFYTFLEEIAKRMDFEMFVDFRERTTPPGEAPVVPGAPPPPGPPPSHPEVALHFEPARSALPPVDPIVQLAWGQSLIDFTPRFKVWDMPMTSMTAGSDPARPRERVREELTLPEVIAAVRVDLHRSPSYDAEMVSALDARVAYARGEGASEDNAESSPSSNLDRTRARLQAIAQVRTKTREFLTADGTTIGFPALRPGIHAHVLGLRPPFDGFYYVTKVVHSIDGSGYRTQFSVRRPGMLPPDLYMQESREERGVAGGRS